MEQLEILDDFFRQSLHVRPGVLNVDFLRDSFLDPFQSNDRNPTLDR